MDYEKLDKIFSKYEQIGSYVHRDRFDSLFKEIIEIHEKAIAPAESQLEKEREAKKQETLNFCQWLSERDFTCDMTSPEDWVNMYNKTFASANPFKTEE